MNKNLCILLLTSISQFASAQNHFPVEDDPDYAQLMVRVGMGVETDFDFRTEIPVMAGIHYDLENLPLELDASFLSSVISERKRSFYPENLSGNEFQNYNAFEAGVTFNFWDRTEVKSVQVNVYSTIQRYFTYSKKTTYYVLGNGKVRNRLGGRAGMYRYAQSVTEYDTEDRTWTFNDGTVLTGTANPDSDRPSTDDNYLFSAERHLAAYLGFQYHRSVGLVESVEGYGLRDAESNMIFYADVLFNLASDLQKLSYQGELYDLKEASTSVDLNKVGYRLGATLTTSFLFFTMEFGQRPQYLDPNIYARLAIGYSFNKNL